MASKRGTKERHRAQEAMVSAKGQFDPVRSALAGSGLSQLGMTAAGTGQDLLGALAGILSPGTALPFGLSAPNVLEGLIARSREASSRGASTAAQQMANLIPTRGGAAVRGVSDIFQRAGSEQAGLETSLRAQAAQQDLTNRLGILGGVTSALPGLTQAAGAPVGFQFDIANALSGIDQNRANMYQQQYLQKQQMSSQMLGGLGGFLGQAGMMGLGALLGPLTGGFGMGLPMLGGLFGGGGRELNWGGGMGLPEFYKTGSYGKP